MSHYHRSRVGATCLAALFASGTAYVLFEDVLRHQAPITTAHILTALALIGTIAAGHYVLPEWQARHRLSALGLGLLFAAGTAYVVTSSGARNAEVAAGKVAIVRDGNSERARIEKQRLEAEQMRDVARATLAKLGCKSDDRRADCQRAATSQRVYNAAVRGHSSELREAGPSRTENAGYAHAGHVLAALPGVTASPATIAEKLALLMPFVVVVIAELGTICFTSMALRSAPRAITEREQPFTEEEIDDLKRVVKPDDHPTPPKGSRRKPADAAAERRSRVHSFVAEYRKRHGSDPSPQAVRDATGLPRATAWRYQQETVSAA